MGKCIVKNCKNYHRKKAMDKKIKFFSFPKDSQLRSQWLMVCEDIPVLDTNNCFVCSEHFVDSDYTLQGVLLDEPLNKRHLKTGAMPTKITGHSEPEIIPQRPIKDKQIEQRNLVEQAFSSYEDSKKEKIASVLSHLKNIPGTSQKAIVADTEKTADNEKQWAESEVPEPPCTTSVIETEQLNQVYEVSKRSTMMQAEACAKEFVIARLKATVRKLKARDKKRQKEMNHMKKQLMTIKKIFTPGQLRRLSDPEKALHWKKEDISSAISLYSAGPRSYQLLRKRGYPLPCPSSLTKWAAKIQKTRGTLGSVFSLLSKADYEWRDVDVSDAEPINETLVLQNSGMKICPELIHEHFTVTQAPTYNIKCKDEEFETVPMLTDAIYPHESIHWKGMIMKNEL